LGLLGSRAGRMTREKNQKGKKNGGADSVGHSGALPVQVRAMPHKYSSVRCLSTFSHLHPRDCFPQVRLERSPPFVGDRPRFSGRAANLRIGLHNIGKGENGRRHRRGALAGGGGGYNPAVAAKQPKIRNKKARFNYTIHETIEARLVLEGSEVKALRQGKCNLGDAFGRVRDGEVRLYNMHIGPYEQANQFGHDVRRLRIVEASRTVSADSIDVLGG